MNEIPSHSLRENLGWAVFPSIFHVLALVSTVLRLVHRLRTSRMWWDDYMVVLPLAMNTVNFASLWVLFHFQVQGKENTMLQPPTGISSFWVADFFFFSVVWPSRISIALSFARVFPAFHKARQIAFILAVICALSYLCCVLLLTFECPSVDAPWYKTVASHCHKTGAVFLARDIGSALDLSVDSAFILFPIITLWKVKLPQNLRRIIISAFSGSALITLISALVFFIIASNLNLGSETDAIIRLASHLEAAVSLAVANLLVVVSFFYRIFKQIRDIEGAQPGPPNTRNSPSPITEIYGTNGLARETSIGRVSVLDTEDRPLSFTLTRVSQFIWSSIQVSEPPSLLSENMSAST